jgi:hypothetical protein
MIADYHAETAVERQLVLRLASVLWRVRRATGMETALFESATEDARCLFRSNTASALKFDTNAAMADHCTACADSQPASGTRFSGCDASSRARKMLAIRLVFCTLSRRPSPVPKKRCARISVACNRRRDNCYPAIPKKINIA